MFRGLNIGVTVLVRIFENCVPNNDSERLSKCERVRSQTRMPTNVFGFSFLLASRTNVEKVLVIRDDIRRPDSYACKRTHF